MQLYWSPQSRAFRALWMLEEIGQPYERVHIDIRRGDQNAPGFRRINPMGKVPALCDGAVTLAESGAILLYLGDRFPDAGLAPPMGAPDRGAYLRWLFFLSSALEPALAEKLGAPAGDPINTAWGSYDKVIAVLDEALTPRAWLLGERFSAADVLLGTDLIYVTRIMKVVPETAAFRDYMERCIARPAYQQALAIDAAAA